MLSLARMIKALAERHSLAAVVSNHVVGGGSGGFVKPALGEHWRNQPSWRLLLSNQQGSSVKVAQRLASPLHVSWAGGLLHFKADDICMHTGLDILVGEYKLHQGAGVHLRAAPSKPRRLLPPHRRPAIASYSPSPRRGWWTPGTDNSVRPSVGYALDPDSPFHIGVF